MNRDLKNWQRIPLPSGRGAVKKFAVGLLLIAISLNASALSVHGLPPSEEVIESINLNEMPPPTNERRFTTRSVESDQEVTITRYYIKMLERPPTDDEVIAFFNTIDWWGCDVALLNAWVRAVYNNREFDDLLPSASANPWQRAGELVNKLYEGALARAPDAGGLAYYMDQLYNHAMDEGDFVLAIVNSQEFSDGAAEWCGE